MPATTTPPKSGPSIPRRVFRWLVRLGLVSALLIAVAFVFLPQIATRVIAQFTDGLGIAQFDVTVEDVGWNEATLAGLRAADGPWQAGAESIVVSYHPWDLLHGKIRQVTMHGLRLSITTDLPASPVRSGEATGEEAPPFAWLHALPKSLSQCPHISAPAARVTITRESRAIEHKLDLTVRPPARGHPILVLESEAGRLTADLESRSSGSLLAIKLSTPNPDVWLTATEVLMGATAPYLPAELTAGPVEIDTRTVISDRVESIDLVGSTPMLRYRGSAPDISGEISVDALRGTIRPGGESYLGLRGHLLGFTVESEAIPGGTLVPPEGSRPSWTARLAWDPEGFTYTGRVDEVFLRGGSKADPIKISNGTAEFSNQDATFRTNGELWLNGTTLPFAFALQPVEAPPSRAPNATLTLDRTPLDRLAPLYAHLLPPGDVPAVSGTVAKSSLSLRLAPDEPVSGRLDAKLTDLACPDLGGGIAAAGAIHAILDFQTFDDEKFSGSLQFRFADTHIALEDELAVAAGLTGFGSVTIPADDASPLSWQASGTATRVTIDTGAPLGFPLAHTTETPAAFTSSGIHAKESSTVRGYVSKLTLDGTHRGESVRFAESTFDLRLTDDVLTAMGRTTYEGNDIPFTYTHTREARPDADWIVTGKLEVPLVTLEKPVGNAGAFSEAAAGMSFSGKAATELTFRVGSEDPFQGALDLSVTDGTLVLPDDGPTLTGIGVHYVTNDLDTLHTENPLRFAIGELSYGDLSFTDLAGRYQVRPNGGIALSGIRSSFLGGRFTIDPFTYPADEQDQLRMHIRFKALKLRRLTELFPGFDGQLDGTIDGDLPIVRRNGSFSPERGGIQLTPRTTARLRYRAEGLFTGGLDPGGGEFRSMKLAEDSLKNLRIGRLSGRFFDPRDQDKAAVIRIEGQSPEVKDAPPIHLNFNFFEPEGEFRELVDHFFKNRGKLDFGL